MEKKEVDGLVNLFINGKIKLTALVDGVWNNGYKAGTSETTVNVEAETPFSEWVAKQSDLNNAGEGYEQLSQNSKKIIDYAVKRYITNKPQPNVEAMAEEKEQLWRHIRTGNVIKQKALDSLSANGSAQYEPIED